VLKVFRIISDAFSCAGFSIILNESGFMEPT
jgi:hypothetical protein